jgi:hypothetical protein
MRKRFARRTIGRFLTIFAISLVPFAAASNLTILGQIVRSQGAAVGGTAVPNEGSVVAGDVLETSAAGSALLRFQSQAEAVVGASTRVTFSAEGGGLAAHLASGAVTIEMMDGTPFATATPNCKVEAAGHAPAGYTVSFKPGQGTAVESRKGTLRVTALPSGRTRFVASGQEAVVAQNASGSQSANPQPEVSKPAPSLPAGPAQPPATATAPNSGAAPQSATARQESGRPAPSQAAGPAAATTAAGSHSAAVIVLLGVGVAGAAGAALAASGGGGGPASPSAP